MVSRPAYVAVLGVAIAALQFAAGFGEGWRVTLAWLVAAGLGVVVFYQGERRITAGSAFVNAGAALLLGTLVSWLFGAGLVMVILGAPWDVTLWQLGLLLWDAWAGVIVAFVSAFFVVGVAASVT